MYTFITLLIIIVCVLMILIVLVQKPKGGGLASNFSATNQVMGVKRTTDVVEKATWILSVSLFVLAMMINIWIPRDDSATVPGSTLKEKAEQAPINVPNTPAPGAEQPAGTEMVAPEKTAE
ncbi:MAG: preprotein translocase subunit SecG [Sphingobacteriaceae bacterium]|nr:preprotein translocase subunit SecG [Sphingobacteriaceae bacterium]